jgi:hypothetical protein
MKKSLQTLIYLCIERRRDAKQINNRCRKAKRLIEFEYGEESFLGYFHVTDLLHAFLSFFLFFEQLALTRDIATITLGGNVFS